MNILYSQLQQLTLYVSNSTILLFIAGVPLIIKQCTYVSFNFDLLSLKIQDARANKRHDYNMIHLSCFETKESPFTYNNENEYISNVNVAYFVVVQVQRCTAAFVRRKKLHLSIETSPFTNYSGVCRAFQYKCTHCSF